MSNQKALAEAADWLAKREIAADPEGFQREFRRWWNRSERNREAYRELEGTAHQLTRVREQGLLPKLLGDSTWSPSFLPAVPPDVSDSTKTATNSTNARAPRPTRPLHVKRARHIAIATVLLAAGIGIWMKFRSHPDAGAATGVPDWAPYSADVYDKVRTFVLPDHSIVKLNSDSRIKVRYTGASREVQLERGDAQFRVAPQPTRPFVVYVGTITVRALGTTFTVSLKGSEEVETLVSLGSVLVTTSDSHPKQLGAGEAALVSQGHLHIERPLASGRDPRMAWVNDKLFFGEGEPLYKAIREFNRFNVVQLQIQDSRIAGVPIGGVFDKHDPESFALALRELKIQYVAVGTETSYSRVLVLSRAP